MDLNEICKCWLIRVTSKRTTPHRGVPPVLSKYCNTFYSWNTFYSIEGVTGRTGSYAATNPWMEGNGRTDKMGVLGLKEEEEEEAVLGLHLTMSAVPSLPVAKVGE